MLKLDPATSQRWLASFGVLWLSVVGALIWLHARESALLPIYDAYTYFVKAKNVWEAVQAGRFGLKQLLAVESTLRPFGTVLMSYPFGFTTDLRGFYFRSTFFPVALVCIAGFIGSWTAAPSGRYARYAALTACFLSTLSLFFDFELYTGGPPAFSYWGLVDGFLTGLAALSMATCIRGLRQRSVAWSIVSVITALLMIFVKPSGLLLAAICGATIGIGWICILQADWRTSLRANSARRALVVLLSEAVVLGGGALAALRSAYLGPDNLKNGNAQIDIMRAELRIDWLTQAQVAIHGLGPFVLIWIIAMATICLLVRTPGIRMEDKASSLDVVLLTLAALTLVVGFWFWSVGSGGQTVVRYFAPFLYAAIFCALPALLKALVHAPIVVRRALGVFMLGTMANLLLLLALPDPSLLWQTWSGVNVKSGTHPKSIQVAKALVKEPLDDASTTTFVYSLINGNGVADAMFEAVFDLRALERKVPRYSVRRPVDWQRPTVVRIGELISSDYILANPDDLQPGFSPASGPADDEIARFNAWAISLTEKDGVQRVASEPDLLLLRITDRAKLQASLTSLLAAHQWRRRFVEENLPSVERTR